MSTLTIDANAKPIQVLRPTTVSKVSTSGTAASATAIVAGIRVARIVSDSDCFYSVTGTATTSSSYLPANAIEYVHVFTGDTVSVILASGTGSAYITSMV
jgi:hypothetical protein|tara:strand:+ start:1035 stop:1334 length:300 start_codon:yes stop_codon:yes gene_type:complete